MGELARPIQEADLRGFKYLRPVLDLLPRLRDVACARDRAHNRILHYDQFVALLLLSFFNPVVRSLRGLRQASALAKVQRVLGCARAALGSLSEASRVFDSELLLGLIAELVPQLPAQRRDPRLGDLRQVLTLVDGTLWPAWPRITCALWQDDQHRAFKLHPQYELWRGVPVAMDLTADTACEWKHLAQRLQAGRLYVLDRGYGVFGLMRAVLAAGASFVVRVKDDTVCRVRATRPLSAADRAAGVVSDQVVDLGAQNPLGRPVRLIQVACPPHRKTGKTARGGPEQGETLLIVTDRLDLSAEVIAPLYQHRWGIEIFFRFFKHVLGCRHLLFHSRNGLAIQTYVAILACLLIALWTGRRPTLRTYEMLCHYSTGLASEAELLAHLAPAAAPSRVRPPRDGKQTASRTGLGLTPSLRAVHQRRGKGVSPSRTADGAGGQTPKSTCASARET